MPLTQSMVHIDRPLTNISIAYIQSTDDFIATRVFPQVPSLKQSDIFFSYDRSYWMRTGAQLRAPATESAGGGFKIDANNTFYCKKYSFHMDLAEEVLVSADDPLNINKSATEFVTRNLLLRREKSFMSRYLAPNVWTGFGQTNSNFVYTTSDFTPAIAWSDDKSNPINDIAMLKTAIKKNTSMTANTLVVTHDVNERLKQHPMILSRIIYSQRGVLTEELIAEFFGVERYLVSSVVETQTQDGQVPVYGFMAGNGFLLCYSAKSPSLATPSAGYCFNWSGLIGGGADGMRMKTIPIPEREAIRVEGDMCFDFKIVAPDCGVLGVSVL